MLTVLWVSAGWEDTDFRATPEEGPKWVLPPPPPPPVPPPVTPTVDDEKDELLVLLVSGRSGLTTWGEGVPALLTDPWGGEERFADSGLFTVLFILTLELMLGIICLLLVGGPVVGPWFWELCGLEILLPLEWVETEAGCSRWDNCWWDDECLCCDVAVVVASWPGWTWDESFVPLWDPSLAELLVLINSSGNSSFKSNSGKASKTDIKKEKL